MKAPRDVVLAVLGPRFTGSLRGAGAVLALLHRQLRLCVHAQPQTAMEAIRATVAQHGPDVFLASLLLRCDMCVQHDLSGDGFPYPSLTEILLAAGYSTQDIECSEQHARTGAGLFIKGALL